MPKLLLVSAQNDDPAAWSLSFQDSEEEDERWGELEEMLPPDGPQKGVLHLQEGSAYSKMEFELNAGCKVMKWKEVQGNLHVSLNRTAPSLSEHGSTSVADPE